MPHSRHYLLQASDEFEMNEWIALINYASAFKTADIRMRGSAMKKEQAVLAGAAAAASHQRELRDNEASSDNNGLRKAVFGEAAGPMTVTGTGKPPVRVDIGDKKASVDVNGANDIAVNEGEQLEEVFGDVKAEISAVRGEATKNAPYAARQPAERLSSSAQVSRAQAVQVRCFILKS